MKAMSKSENSAESPWDFWARGLSFEYALVDSGFLTTEKDRADYRSHYDREAEAYRLAYAMDRKSAEKASRRASDGLTDDQRGLTLYDILGPGSPSTQAYLDELTHPADE